MQSRIETMNRVSAIRTARTAITNAQSAGTLASMKRLAALGVEVQKEWMATLDSRTRESHRNLDGERRELDERFSNGLMYPGASGSAKEVYNCRCTMVSYLPKYDSEDEPRVTYSEWTEYKKASGSVSGKISGEEYAKATTWNNKRKTTVNKARAIDSIHLSFGAGAYKYTPESIIQEMEKSPVGQKAIETVETSYVSITIANGEWSTGCRGESYRNDIILYQNNIGSVRVAAQTLIHEITHYKYGIGGCQHAEAICFAFEKMHLMGRDYLTKSEWNYVKQLAIDNYPELNWEEGGYGNYEQFDFIRE